MFCDASLVVSCVVTELEISCAHLDDLCNFYDSMTCMH